MQTDESLLTAGVQVWVPHPTDGFRAAEVVEHVPKKGIKVRIIDQDEKPIDEIHPHTSIWLRNPVILEGVDDLTKLSYMHEAAILHNLHMRYMTMQVYTYTGPILIAVNPYQRLPIYSKQMISQYCGQPLGKLSPHVYAIAEDAFRAMLTERRSQSILVSGESGAGKTETAKFLLQYFAAMGEENKGEGNVHNQVLESTPLLEAFGNAKTLRNDNSSRFGKFIGIQFDRNGNISGASIQTYLLEKSRIVRQMNGERNYHIFYQLIAGATDEEKATYHLTSIADYHYTCQSDCQEIEGIADEKVFGHTKKALTIAGIGADVQVEMWKLVSAILHLGNWKKGNDGPLQLACALMECDFEGIKSSLTQRKVVAVREVYIVDLDDEQSEGARDALAMLLYARLFDWLVVALNDNLQRSKKTGFSGEEDVFIGVLDIYGFESFDVNSFEQFCINYANEKVQFSASVCHRLWALQQILSHTSLRAVNPVVQLQQQFNQHMFKVEQQEYVKEKLDWSYINFNDNQECLDLIEKKPLGILSLLDEECRFPKSSPKSLALKLKQNHIKSKYFKSDPRQSENSFVVHHYAGSVGYDTTFFLDKNKDFLIEDQVKVLLDSKSSFVRGIFAPKPQQPSTSAAPAKGGRSESSAVKFISVASQFRDSLAELMSTIEKTSPHYVRCIKPNHQKRQGIFEKPKVLEQLRCGGVLESVRVCMAGYPGRHSYDQFYKRYRIVEPSAGSGASDAQTATKALVAALKLGPGQYQFGLTKLFLKGGEIAILERKRGEKLSDAAVTMQKTWRRFKARKHLRRLKESLVRMQSFVRMVLAKKLLVVLRRQRAATNIQKALRSWRARTRFTKQKKALIYVQRVFKAKREKRILRALRREKAATVIQAAVRGKLQRKRYHKAYRQVTLVQGLWRVKKAKALLEKLKRKAQALSKVVAAKAALEKKVDEMELRYAVESKMKKKVEKENARIKAELEELKKTIKDMKSLEEKREKEKEEAAARREKEGQNKARGHEREVEELKAKLREETEARARSIAELSQVRSTLDLTCVRADEAERQRDGAQAEVAQLRERLAALEGGDAEKDRVIAELKRDAEKIRIRAPKKKMEGEKMERLQDRKSDYASMKSLREGGGLSSSSSSLTSTTRRARSSSTELHERSRSRHSERDGDGDGNDSDRAERERKLRLGRSPSARDIRPRDRQREKEKEQDKKRLEHEREKKKKDRSSRSSSATSSATSSPSSSPSVARAPERAALPKLELPVNPTSTISNNNDDDDDKRDRDEDVGQADSEKDVFVDVELTAPVAPAPGVSVQPAVVVKPVERAQSHSVQAVRAGDADSDYVDSRNLTDKDRQRREREREIIDRLKDKYEGKHSLVGLDNEAIMTLLPDALDVTSRNFLRFLLSELEPGFVSGVPVPAFVIYSFLCFWNLLSPKTPRKADDSGEPEGTLAFILEGIYDGAKGKFRENEMIMYDLASSLYHLVDQRLARGDDDSGDTDSNDAAGRAVDDDNTLLPDELFVMESLDDVDDEESCLTFTNKQRAEIRSASFTAYQFKQHLRELVRRLYTVLLKRAHQSLERMLNEIVLGKDWTSASPFRSGPQQRAAVKNTSSDSITGLLSQYLLGLVQNFIYLSLVQKFFSQVLWFVNSILFNEVLLCTQFCSTTKAMDLKVHLSNIDRWIQEEGGLWLESSSSQLSHLEQLITLLMINKKHIVSSDQMRKEVIPKLNILQIKQVLAMYTPTDLEERISLADIQKLDRAARSGNEDDALLLESTKLFPLAAKELHYLELDDANSIPFPFEIKQKIHDIVEQDILKRMTVATKVKQVREKRGRLSTLLYTSRGSRKDDAPSAGAGASASETTSSATAETPAPTEAASSPRGGGLSFLQRLTESTMLPQRRGSSPAGLSSARTAPGSPSPSPLTETPAPAALGVRRSSRPAGGDDGGEDPRERRRREQEEIEQLQREIERNERRRKEQEEVEQLQREIERKQREDTGPAASKAETSGESGGGGGGRSGACDGDAQSGSDSEDGGDIEFDEEDDKAESERRTKAALSAVVRTQGRSGSFWSSFFK